MHFSHLLRAWELLNGSIVELIAALIGGLVYFSLERLTRWIRSRRLAAKYPIAGKYITEFEERGAIYRAPATLKQSGTVIHGETRSGNRKWILEGEVTPEGYLIGKYKPESVHDKGLGNFFLKIDLHCDMHGIWSGLDAEKNEIQQGSYVFHHQSGLVILPVAADHVPEILQIAEKELGDAYIDRTDLLAEGAFYAKIGEEIVGFATSKVIQAPEFLTRFERFCAQDHSVLSAWNAALVGTKELASWPLPPLLHDVQDEVLQLH